MTIQPSNADTASTLGFRGVHHLVLNTDDIKTTIDFYSGVLGMPLIHAMRVPAGVSRGNPPFDRIRHYFFDMGNDSLLAFFEIPKGREPAHNRNAIGAMQHCAFVVTPERFRALEARLDRAGVNRLGPFEAAPGTYSTYFYDPHGVRLEVSYQVKDGDDQHIVEGFRQNRETMLKELRTVSDDAAWLDWVTADLD